MENKKLEETTKIMSYKGTLIASGIIIFIGLLFRNGFIIVIGFLLLFSRSIFPTLYKKNNTEDFSFRLLTKKKIGDKENKNPKTKIIKETKCTCNVCGKIWHYGKRDEELKKANDLGNLSKAMFCCGGCLPALLIPDKKVIDLNKCPECGSKNIKNEEVKYEVSR